MSVQTKTLKHRLFGLLPFVVFASVLYGIHLLFERYRWQLQVLVLSDVKRDEFFAGVAITFQDFITLTLGILVEALPFVILGVMISVLVQTYVSTDWLVKLLPKNKALRQLCVSFFGVLLPVCECGNVPVARTLIMKGFSVREAITFLLAAPSVNIITFIVTWEAFSFNHSMAVVRVIGTIIIANITAYLVTRFINKDKLLTDQFVATCKENDHAHHGPSRMSSMFRSEMWLITRLLIIGALIAAASQVFIPREVITSIGSDPILAVVAMLGLAFVISICSSVDAFFALAYVNTFSQGAILAFLLAGPMVDIKMIALMKTTFTYRVLAVITTSVFVMSLMMGILFTYVW
ncbi:MAG TPA: permease [Candidatus Saccharimonadales bacterium]|jgi:hypothetical protein